MYICPICNNQFNTEDQIVKHSLSCWKEHNPNYKSASAPKSKDIVQYEISPVAENIFLKFSKRNKL